MKASSIKYGVLTGTLSMICVILVLLPFHAFLTVWLSSIFGQYTLIRLWKEFLLIAAFIGVLYLIAFDKKVRAHTLGRKLTWIMLAYLFVQIVWGVVAWQLGEVTLKAAAFGVLLNTRYIVMFLLAWAIAIRTERFEKRWPKLLLWPAVIVVVFGLMQVFLLPIDFLRHFGYSKDTILPYQTINHNIDYIRYMSTLRGSNPLGAYLLLPISALVVLLVRFPRSWNWTKVLLLVGSLAMLLFSFSRSAWIGAFLSTVVAVLLAVDTRVLRRHAKVLTVTGGVFLILCLGGAFAMRNSAQFQNLIYHTEDNSQVAVSSNDDHESALKEGARDLTTYPLGDGPGSAGPASVYNDGRGRIAENYYLQLGQETGWPGLILFLVIVGGVAYLLWVRRNSTLALALLAALVGISFINLLSHAWTDDTLAYIWWGLAGLAVGTPVITADHGTKNHTS